MTLQRNKILIMILIIRLKEGKWDNDWHIINGFKAFVQEGK